MRVLLIYSITVQILERWIQPANTVRHWWPTFFFFQLLMKLESQCVATCLVCARLWCVREQTYDVLTLRCSNKKGISCLTLHIKKEKRCQYLIKSQSQSLKLLNVGCGFSIGFHAVTRLSDCVVFVSIIISCANRCAQVLWTRTWWWSSRRLLQLLPSLPARRSMSRPQTVRWRSSRLETASGGHPMFEALKYMAGSHNARHCRCRAVTYQSSPVSLLSCLSLHGVQRPKT